MNSFKQKLKSLLNDSSSIKDTSNIDQKFEQFLLRTYRKIKLDNTRQSLLVSTYKNNFSNNFRKTTRNSFINNSKISEKKRGISPNIAERMAQTFSLMKNENSSNIYNNFKSEMFYNALNKYMNNSSKIKRKIQRSIDYIIQDKNNSTIRYSANNRPKSLFNKTININNIYSNNKNKTIYNIRKIYENNNEKISKEKEKDITGESFRNNLRKGKIDFNDYFNQFRNRQKYINFNF